MPSHARETETADSSGKYRKNIDLLFNIQFNYKLNLQNSSLNDNMRRFRGSEVALQVKATQSGASCPSARLSEVFDSSLSHRD